MGNYKDNKMEARLKEKLSDGKFYDYSELVRTLFFKYKLRNKTQQMQDLISQAMVDLSTND